MMHADTLFQLAYISQRSDSVTDDDVIDAIVLPAMAKNRRLDITGCLWISPGRFLQVIEGAEPTIRDLFDTIRADDRHHRIDVLIEHPIQARQFERFHMRAIGTDTPPSVQALIHQAEQQLATASLSIALDFENMVRRVIGDLSAWPASADGAPPTPTPA